MITTWGPLFRISFDLIIYSKPEHSERVEYTIIQFKESSAKNCSDAQLSCNIGSKVPRVSHVPYRNPEVWKFTSAINDNGNYYTKHFFNIDINKKYKFVVEQKNINNEVCYVLICLINRITLLLFIIRYSLLHQ